MHFPFEINIIRNIIPLYITKTVLNITIFLKILEDLYLRFLLFYYSYKKMSVTTLLTRIMVGRKAMDRLKSKLKLTDHNVIQSDFNMFI